MSFRLTSKMKRDAFEDRGVKQGFRMEAQKKFKIAHVKLMKAFEDHPVTRELETGGGSSRYISKGSLFGFIGFEKGSSPVSSLRRALQGASILVHKPMPSSFSYTFRAKIPTDEELYALTPLPWAKGRSWLRELEGGLSNLGGYIPSSSETSRSGEGIQSSSSRAGGSIKVTDYLTGRSGLMKVFEQDLNRAGGFSK